MTTCGFQVFTTVVTPWKIFITVCIADNLFASDFAYNKPGYDTSYTYRMLEVEINSSVGRFYLAECDCIHQLLRQLALRHICANGSHHVIELQLHNISVFQSV